MRGTRHRAIGHGEPDVACGIDDRCGTAHPDAAFGFALRGIGLERPHLATRLGDADDVAVVGPTVVETGVGDDDPALRRGEPGALQLQERLRARRVGTLVELDAPVEEVEAVEAVLGLEPVLLHGHDEDLVPGEIDVGRPGDADLGRHDARAREARHRDGRAEVDAPQDAPGLGREGVDGVVRGGHDDASVGDERLAEDAVVELGGGPPGLQRTEVRVHGVHTRRQWVLVVHRPVRPEGRLLTGWHGGCARGRSLPERERGSGHDPTGKQPTAPAAHRRSLGSCPAKPACGSVRLTGRATRRVDPMRPRRPVGPPMVP